MLARGLRFAGAVPAIARLQYYGGIKLNGLPAPHAVLIGATWPCSRGGSRFNASAPILSGLLTLRCRSVLAASLTFGSGRVVSVLLPRVSPHPLRGPRTAWRAVLPQECNSRGRQPAPPKTNETSKVLNLRNNSEVSESQGLRWVFWLNIPYQLCF